MYVILGATGNTGSVATETLLAKKQQVRVVGRSKEHLSRFTFAARRGLSRTSRILPLCPKPSRERARLCFDSPKHNQPRYPRLSGSGRQFDLFTRWKPRKWRTLLALSSIGAEKPEKTGPVGGASQLLEKRSGSSAPFERTLALRAGYFMENTFPQAGVIKNIGKTVGPLRADLAVPADRRSRYRRSGSRGLAQSRFHGQQTHELLGQRDLTYIRNDEDHRGHIGKTDLTYVQLPADQVDSGTDADGHVQEHGHLALRNVRLSE